MSIIEQTKYWRADRILKEHANYNMIIGERSNGKTYGCLDWCLKDYFETGHQLAVIRRWDNDFKSQQGKSMFRALVKNGLVKKYSGGKYDNIIFRRGAWYIVKYDAKLDKYIGEDEPFAISFSLNAAEHYKSSSYPDIYNILFDEFIASRQYLEDEFVIFMNLISTIVRDRDPDELKIFMCANTINKYNPYFIEMGIDNADDLEQGKIYKYEYKHGLTVALEYADNVKGGKKSDKLFAFNNSKLNMITDGKWQLAMYPHRPKKFKSSDIQLTYFVIFGKQTLQCEIVVLEDEGNMETFTYIHRKTTPIKNYTDIVYSQEYSTNPYHFRKLTKPKSEIEKKIAWYYVNERVFYQDNEVGNIMSNYLQWSANDNIII